MNQEFANIILKLTSDPTFITTIYLSIFGSIIYYKANTAIKYYRFKENNRYTRIGVLSADILEKIDEFNENKVQEEFKEELINFYNILKANFDEETLINFNNNINSLIINKNKKMGFFAGGSYSSGTNTINIKNIHNLSVLYHELLHMASRDKNGFTGFRQNLVINGKNVTVGIGFNEGYTELLNRRYFNPDSKCSPIYEYMVKVVRCMEIIVGKDLMEKSYFKTDLGTVCLELLKYSNDLELYNFIKNVDYMFYLFRNREGTMIDFKYNKNIFEQINNFLVKAYKNKLISEGNMSEEKINEFISFLPTKYRDDKNNYSFGFNANILKEDSLNKNV